MKYRLLSRSYQVSELQIFTNIYRIFNSASIYNISLKLININYKEKPEILNLVIRVRFHILQTFLI